MSVLSTDTGADSIDTTEGDWASQVSRRHVKRLGSRVDNVIDRLQGEVEGHELDDGAEAFETCTDGNTREASLGDWSVPDSIAAISIPHALRDFVSSVVLRDFFANQEDTRISFDLVTHRTVNRLSNRHLVVGDWSCSEGTAGSHALQESDWPSLDGVLHHRLWADIFIIKLNSK